MDGLANASSGWHDHLRRSTTMGGVVTAGYFDGWYADMVESSAKDRLMQRHLGLPPELLSTSLLTWDGIGDVVDILRLAPGATLLDLACGRGGYGGEVSRRTDARLLGVDFSAEALRQARLRKPDAEFRLGDLTATGLDDASVDAAMCIDAIQFGDPQSAAYAELRRVVKPGGRVVLTGWEGRAAGDDRLPKRLRDMNMRDGLIGAGFRDVDVRERPDWQAIERGLYEDAAGLEPGDDPALQSLHEEATRSLETLPLIRRVVATAIS
jgi:SAM-dependent methyltransferase